MTYMNRSGNAWRQMGDDGDATGSNNTVSTVPPGGITGGAGGDVASWFQPLIDAMAAFPDADPADPADTGSSQTVTSADFNCTKYPGICKPMTLATLSIVQAMQGQLNRVATVKGFKLTAVDGGVGPDTLRLFNQVAAISSGMYSQVSNVANLAADSDVYASETKTLADKFGAPAAVAPPAATSPATIVNRNGVEKKAPAQNQAAANTGIIAAFTGLSTVAQVAAVGIVGLGVYHFTKKRKRR